MTRLNRMFTQSAQGAPLATFLCRPSVLLSLLFTLGVTSSSFAEVDLSVGTLQFSRATYQGSEQDQVLVTVTRTNGSVGALTVKVVAGGEGDSASLADYTLLQTGLGTTLSWADGDTSAKTVRVDLTADSLVEGTESATLYLQVLNQATPLGSPSLATLTILDTPIAPVVVDQIKTLAGNYQQGGPDDVLDPFEITALDAAGEAVAGVSVAWTILPLAGGSLTTAMTVTDNTGQSSNVLTLSTSERVIVTATVTASKMLVNEESVKFPIAVSHAGAATAIFIVNGGLADQPGLSRNQQSVARAMDTLCTALVTLGNGRSAAQDDLLNTCTRLDSDDSALLASNLDVLAHEEVTAQGRVIIDSAKLQSSSIHRRLSALRNGSRGVNLAGLKIQVDGKVLPAELLAELFGEMARGGSAGDETPALARRWGAFINADVVAGDRKKTANEAGYDQRSNGVTAGVDYRVSDQLVIGNALGFAKNQSEFDNGGGELAMDNVHLSVYGSYYRSASFYLDGLIRVGKNTIDSRRQMNLSGAPQQDGVGSTKGWEYALSVSGGYEFSRNAWTLGPYGRLGYIRATIDGYTETASNASGAGAGSVLSVARQDVGSLASVLGGMASYAISTRSAVYLLQVNGEWAHEFMDNSRTISAQFYYDPTRSSFNIYSDNPDRDYFNLGLGMTGVFANGKSAFIYYESRLGQDNVQLNWVNLGFRMEL